MVPADWKVRIRMYRKWLGDCFLLTFRSDGNPVHIMIDCGALTGTPGGKRKITQAVDDIFHETGGSLAALVVTHEHWDHVSGFVDAIDTFKRFKGIEEVWAAWTENPNDTVAKERKRQNQLYVDTLAVALHHWNSSASDEDQRRGAALSAVMDFVAPGGVTSFSQTTDTAMQNALSLGRERLLNPGDTVEMKQVPGLRVHVLGPPTDTKSLHTLAGKVGSEMYGLAAGSSDAAITAALGAALERQTTAESLDHYAPFETYMNWSEAAWATAWPHLARSYIELDRLRHKGEPSRRIDDDWLDSAAELALQLDSYTNNTSLVLAFELPDNKDVLLFVGDAQIGSWESWANVKFAGEGLTAADLLRRTVFYKVGHHGSHNATLKDGGLERMVSPRLVTAIPVDEAFAHRPKGGNPGGWDMPAPALLRALSEKSRGRVLRGDSDFPLNSVKPAQLTIGEWKQFQEKTNIQEQFIEYFLP
jgi:beta-lactamase superfamily II metal-dependent hydrolase